ncbi:MAG: hypothetical protein QOI56_1946, partial [Actinomycetota bacterium]|nr:hypothetical protein [Actinomycetota bacterium]
GGLPTFGPSMTWESHVAPFLGYQRYLVSLLDTFINSGCGGFEDLPEFAVDQAFRPVPEPNVLVPGNGYNSYSAPQPIDTGFHVPGWAKWVGGGLVVIGGAALIIGTDGAAAPLLLPAL